MNFVSLPALKKLRYAHDDTVRPPKLQRWARNGLIPGAFKPSPTAEWLVDIDEFDAEMKKAKCQAEPEKSRESRLYRMVVDLMRGHLQ